MREGRVSTRPSMRKRPRPSWCSVGAPFWAQIAAAIVGSGVGLAGLAPMLRRRLSPQYQPTGIDAIPGSEAMVVEAIEPPLQGKVKLNGVVWQATSNLAIPAGTQVIVTEVEGACLTVLARGALMSSQTTRHVEEQPHRLSE